MVETSGRDEGENDANRNNLEKKRFLKRPGHKKTDLLDRTNVCSVENREIDGAGVDYFYVTGELGH